MAGASSEFKRLLLKGVSWDAAKNAIRLSEALQSACQARLSENNRGLIVSSIKGNGAEMVFALPQIASTISPEAVIYAVSQLHDLYEETNADLISAGTAAPTDAQLLAEMLYRLKPKRAMREDYSRMCLT